MTYPKSKPAWNTNCQSQAQISNTALTVTQAEMGQAGRLNPTFVVVVEEKWIWFISIRRIPLIGNSKDSSLCLRIWNMILSKLMIQAIYQRQEQPQPMANISYSFNHSIHFIMDVLTTFYCFSFFFYKTRNPTFAMWFTIQFYLVPSTICNSVLIFRTMKIPPLKSKPFEITFPQCSIIQKTMPTIR